MGGEIRYYRGTLTADVKQFIDLSGWIPRKAEELHFYDVWKDFVGCRVVDGDNASIFGEVTVRVQEKDESGATTGPEKTLGTSDQTVVGQVNAYDAYGIVVEPPLWLRLGVAIRSWSRSSGLHAERFRYTVGADQSNMDVTESFEGTVLPGEALQGHGVLTGIDRAGVPPNVVKQCEELAKD